MSADEVSMHCILILVAGAALASEGPSSERFRGPELDPAWTADASDGTALSVRDGMLEIRAPANTFAHVERRLGWDLVRASSFVKAAPAVSWATSIFLYWAPGDWCQLGVIDRDGGRFYVTEMVEGHPFEHDLDRCDFAAWHGLAIELGQDCIRYLSSADGRAWERRRIAARPARFRGPPALLVVGKGYGRGDAAYPKPDLDNEFADRGEGGVSYVREVAAERLDPDRAAATLEERLLIEQADRDPLGEAQLAGGKEPSFESVAGLLPPLKHAREITGVKDHPHDIGVTEDGSIELSDDRGLPTAFFEIGEPAVRFGSTGIEKRLLDGYLPMIIGTFAKDGVTCEELVFGHSEGMRPDAELVAYARLTVTNGRGEARSLPITLRVQTKEGTREAARRTVELPPRGTGSVHVRIPFADPNAATEIEAGAFDRCLAEARDAWKRLLGSGMRLDLPEPMVGDAFRAWLAYAFLDVDKRGEVYEPHDGAGFYEEVYGYSAALFCNALDLCGLHDQARRYLESLLTFQGADGSLVVNYGLPDMGALLFALTAHYRMSGDAAWLRGVAPRMEAMCRWLIARRKESMREPGPGGGRPVTYGLIKFRPYCDHAEPCFDYYGDAYSCTGIERTARAFAEIGLEERAAELRQEAAAYRRDILASMAAATIERDGLPILPLEPDTHRLLKSTGYRAGGYYGLVASMLLESGFLRPNDEPARHVVGFLRAKGGLILGLSEFARGVDHAYTYGYWLTCLERDEAERAILGLYASLAYGMSRGTYAGVEVTQILTGENTPTLPHLYSCTQQLRLLRMMLLREDGDRLIIGQAIPRAWLADGKRVAVAGAPTTFGPVSFSIDSRLADGKVVVRLDPPARRPPAAISLRLRTPGRRAISGARASSGEAVEVRGEDIELRRVAGPVTIEVEYR